MSIDPNNTSNAIAAAGEPSAGEPTPVVVVQERRRSKTPAFIAAGAIALAAALGGGTWALWSAEADFDGGRIVAGNLNVELQEDTTYWDVSADRSDVDDEVIPGASSIKAHAIDGESGMWNIVPGDKVAFAFTAGVTLQGDNLVAQLSVEGLDSLAETNFVEDTTSEADDMTYTYEIYQDDELLISERALPTTAVSPLLILSATTYGQESGADDAESTTPVYAMDPNSASSAFTIVIYGAFDGATAERFNAFASDALSQPTLKLEQIRTPGVGKFVTAP